MRVVDTVVKRSAGRTTLEPLKSTDFVRVNERALSAIAEALAHPDEDLPGRVLVTRLRALGLIAEGEPTPWVVRDASDVISVEVEPIGACNLVCGHCFVELSGRRMTTDTFEAVLEGAVRLGAVEMSFNGGEPLLHPNILNFIERARDAGLRVVLYTNGTRVKPEIADRLAAAQLAKVAISLDGFADAHDSLRGPGTFARAHEGVRMLTARGVPVQATIMVHPGNASDIDTFVHTCRAAWGVRWVRLSTVAPLGRGSSRPDLLPTDELFMEHMEPPTCSTIAVPGGLPCLAGIDKLYVGAGGDVHGCHLFDTAVPLGWLSDRSLWDIYHSPEGPTANVVRAFDPASLTGCAGCEQLSACKGGCRARAFRTSADLGAADPVACRARGVGG